MADNQVMKTMENLLAAHAGQDFEAARARFAGKDMGEEDKAEGAYDDTPPSSITGVYAKLYRDAYQEANPLVTVD